MSAPTKEERRVCWAARDALWKCLDVTGDNVEACKKFQQEFEQQCPAQWVSYFTKRREFLKYKEKLQTEGYEPAQGVPNP